MKGLKNDFSEETRALFIWNYICWGCDKSKNLSPHHIWKRISDSPYNLAPLCDTCHSDGKVHNKENREKFLKKTLEYLDRNEYKPTKKDKEFLLYLQYLSFVVPYID